jgi:solute carrier family 32 (vesicular inhibitory amino acid transporter)
MIPLNFAPFKVLSVTSAIGIFCFVGILTVLLTTGLAKNTAPGSLREFAKTSALPYDWRTVLKSLGIFMAPWGGHSIVPAVYKDMRHPQKYNKALKYTYSICYGMALSLAGLGYLMFGDAVLAEVTSSIFSTPGYPPVVSAITLVIVTTIPLTKISLNNRPVVDTINRKIGSHCGLTDFKGPLDKKTNRLGRLMRVGVCISCNRVELALALAIPDFGDVTALMGAALCFTISVILPGCLYLRICSEEHIRLSDRIACWALIVIGLICALAGTLSLILE